MKRTFIILAALVFTLFLSSCATTQNAENNKEIAGYNLKSKKERMQNKIINNKNKTMLACQ